MERGHEDTHTACSTPGWQLSVVDVGRPQQRPQTTADNVVINSRPIESEGLGSSSMHGVDGRVPRVPKTQEGRPGAAAPHRSRASSLADESQR